MYAPLSQYRPITPMLILLNMGLVGVLGALGGAPPRRLWIVWSVAGLLTAGIWHVVSRFRLDGGASIKAFAIGWPLLTQVLCFTCCHFPADQGFGISLVQQVALLVLLSLQMSLWQRRVAVIKHLLLGLIVGLTSTLHPHFILFALLVPVASYYMRCSTPRNLLSALTGVLFGIWVTYLGLCLISGMEVADRMAGRYLEALPAWGGWAERWRNLSVGQAILVGYVLVLSLVYALRGMAVDVGQSVRTEASIVLISMVSLAVGVLTVLGTVGLTTGVGMLATLLALQLTVHQANATLPLVEWWILLVLLVPAVLGLLPFFWNL